eukprot:2432908-Rhodomonas_salina.2
MASTLETQVTHDGKHTSHTPAQTHEEAGALNITHLFAPNNTNNAHCTLPLGTSCSSSQHRTWSASAAVLTVEQRQPRPCSQRLRLS